MVRKKPKPMLANLHMKKHFERGLVKQLTLAILFEFMVIAERILQPAPSNPLAINGIKQTTSDVLRVLHEAIFG